MSRILFDSFDSDSNQTIIENDAAVSTWNVPSAVVIAAVVISAAVASSSWSVPSASVQTTVTVQSPAASDSWSVPAATVSVGAVTIPADVATAAWSVPSAAASYGASIAADVAIANWSVPSVIVTQTVPIPQPPVFVEQVFGIITPPEIRPVYIVGTFNVHAAAARLRAKGTVTRPQVELNAQIAEAKAYGTVEYPVVTGASEVESKSSLSIAGGAYQPVPTRLWRLDQPVKVKGSLYVGSIYSSLQAQGTVSQWTVDGVSDIERKGADIETYAMVDG